MAGRIAVVRACEMFLPEDERICSDPYAIRFIDPATRQALEQNPLAFRTILAHIESMLPGISGAIVARVRCFDEFTLQAVQAGATQVLIFGAGYDTRAYRMIDLEKIRIFEIDQPETIRVKKENIREIFGSLPDNVSYVPADLDTVGPSIALEGSGFDPEQRTVVLMEGLVMYLSPASVDQLLAGIRDITPPGSSILFDYCPADDGTHSRAGWDTGRSAAAFVDQQGEPLKSGIAGPIDEFLIKRGFSGVRAMNGNDLRRVYFTGPKSGRTICGIYGIASAIVDHNGCTLEDRV